MIKLNTVIMLCGAKVYSMLDVASIANYSDYKDVSCDMTHQK